MTGVVGAVVADDVAAAHVVTVVADAENDGATLSSKEGTSWFEVQASNSNFEFEFKFKIRTANLKFELRIRTSNSSFEFRSSNFQFNVRIRSSNFSCCVQD